MAADTRRYSCETAAQTLEWMNAIADFIRVFKPLLDAHVVNFFKDRLWELVDEQWMDCLRKESVENLLKLPSGFAQDYWPGSLKQFLCNLKSLVLPREQGLMHRISPNLHVASLGTVLAQGMNLKKKHEVEILAAIVSAITRESGAGTIIDVGSGQGYLAQALSFHYQHSVIAIDASLHHANVTNARAERIKKHYAAKLYKSLSNGVFSFWVPYIIFFLLFLLHCVYLTFNTLLISAASLDLKLPRTVTCNVLSSKALTALSIASLCEDNIKESTACGSESKLDDYENLKTDSAEVCNLSNNHYGDSFLVLTGLHACGDLSVNMLRTFMDCEQVRALVGIGCCYNLLSEDYTEKTGNSCGFPISNAAKLSSIILGKNARDLACQSAERWRILNEDAALQNFDVHAFRAAFQMVLDKYFPEIIVSSPSIGRQGKAIRRQQCRRLRESQPNTKGVLGKDCCSGATGCQEIKIQSQRSNNYMLFEDFCKSGLLRLGCRISEDIDLLEIWNAAQNYTELIGPFWSLRAALGPLVETYILLDRIVWTWTFPLHETTTILKSISVNIMTKK